MSRRLFDSGNLSFISDVHLLLIDEVHLLCDARGPVLEAGVVCRLAALGAMPQLQASGLAHLRTIAVSATIPNIRDVVAWLRVPQQGCMEFGDEMRPVHIAIAVNGYGSSRSDFLFERGLNDKVRRACVRGNAMLVGVTTLRRAAGWRGPLQRNDSAC